MATKELVRAYGIPDTFHQPLNLLRVLDVYGRIAYVAEDDWQKALRRKTLCPMRNRRGVKLADIPGWLKSGYCVMMNPENAQTVFVA